MSIDLNLLAKIVELQSILPALQSNITDEHFEGNERNIWKFIREHYESFHQVPSKQVITDKFGVELPPIVDSIDFLSLEIRNRKLTNELNELSQKFDSNLSASQPQQAVEDLRAFLKEHDQKAPSQNIVPFGEMVDALVLDYQDAKAGKMGIPTLWPKVNEWTMGWWPGDLSFVSGRLGSGKSFFLILVAIAARMANYSVLFISGEMSRQDVARRYASIRAQLPYSALRKGKLGDDYEKKYMKHLEDNRTDLGLHIADSSNGFRSSDVEIMIDKAKADLILVDASYRIKSNQKARDRFENMALVADDLKSYAMKYARPIVATTQLNRESTKKKSLGDDDVALSDVVGWNATNLFALRQSDEDRQKAIMGVYPLKVREGENMGKALMINWNMGRMDFSEYLDIPEVDRRHPGRSADQDIPW